MAQAACAPVPQGVGKIRCSSLTAIALHPQRTWLVWRSMLPLFRVLYEVPSYSCEHLLQPCLVAEPLQGPTVVLSQPPLYAASSHNLFTPSLHGQPCCVVVLHDCSWLAGPWPMYWLALSAPRCRQAGRASWILAGRAHCPHTATLCPQLAAASLGEHPGSWLAGLIAHILRRSVRSSLPPAWANIMDFGWQASWPMY